MNRESHEEVVKTRIETAMDAMFPYGAGRAPHAAVRHHLDSVAQVAFSEGGSYVLGSLLTVEDVAQILKVSTRRVRAIARNRHDRFGIGWQVPGTCQWLFRPEEIEYLRPDEKYRKHHPTQ